MFLEKKIDAFIQKYSLLQKNEKALLAVSGGVDSMTMTHLFHKLGYNFGIAHCNYQLRGASADEDELLVKKTAEKYNVPFHSIRFDTKKIASQKKESIQMAARELRYNFFHTLILSNSYDKIVTAHILEDVLETIFLNITHGTGFMGMLGIKPIQEHIIRPLLWIDKETLQKYAVENNIQWNEDASNSEQYYQRNKIRAVVIPLLKSINPGIHFTLPNTLERIWDTGKWFIHQRNLLEKESTYIRDEYIYLKLHFFHNENKVFLYEVLKKYTSLNYSLFLNIWKSTCKKNVGKIFKTSEYEICLDREQIIIKKIKKNEIPIPISIQSEDTIVEDSHFLLYCSSYKKDNNSFIQNADKNIAFFDYDTLIFPLQVRKWKKGDKWKPLGMNGHKKVSDVLIDKKIPLSQKSDVYVVLSEKTIIWVMGIQISNSYKVNTDTKNILQIQYVEKNKKNF